ncbi:hypothetical protein NL452_27560, partial [Klebsiella pneumoniae]|nr:hypothetical protein [Klebsiella pneumoniae]
GIETSSGSGLGIQSGTNVIGGASAKGDINLIADRIVLANFTGSTGGNIIVKPRSSNGNINIGTSATNSGMQLDATELA